MMSSSPASCLTFGPHPLNEILLARSNQTRVALRRVDTQFPYRRPYARWLNTVACIVLYS
jgi:hypothetical protein